jgi:hypothetical protein
MIDESRLYPAQPPGRLSFIRQLSARIASLLTAKDLTVYQQPGNQKTSQTGAGETAFMSVSHQAWRVSLGPPRHLFRPEGDGAERPVDLDGAGRLSDCTTGFEDTDADSFEWIMEKGNEGA